MRRLVFGEVRFERARRTRWLDLHNLVEIVLTGWMMVVGFTGMMNTWGTFVIDYWRSDQLTRIVAAQPKSDAPLLARADAAVDDCAGGCAGDDPLFHGHAGFHPHQSEPLCRLHARRDAADVTARHAGAG